MEYNPNDDVLLNIGDVAFFFMKKWRYLLIVILVTALLGGCVGALIPIEEPKSTLKAPDKAVLMNMEQTYRIRELYESSLAYCERLDPEQDLETYNIASAALERYASTLQTLEKAFTGDVLTYYQVNYLGIEQPPIKPQKKDFTGDVRTGIILGVLLGGALWFGFYLVFYLRDKHVKTADELQEDYRLPLLGRTHECGADKGIDRILDTWQEKTRHTGVDLPYLVTLLTNMNDCDVTVCGDQNGEFVKKIMDGLADAVPGVQTSGLMSESVQALEQVRKTGREILVVQTWKTKRRQVRRELELCKMQNIQFLGVIVID